MRLKLNVPILILKANCAYFLKFENIDTSVRNMNFTMKSAEEGISYKTKSEI
jgi:hypothetical protein